jgi:hypothetical protein
MKFAIHTFKEDSYSQNGLDKFSYSPDPIIGFLASYTKDCY